MSSSTTSSKSINLIILVAALGYFVDIYDLILFGIVKDPSLRDLGVLQEDMFSTGSYLLNMQMAGMLIGGIIWGVLGDKRGRLSTLFLTILLYSLANIANGFVQTIPQYAWVRLIAGIGLAGELGVGITLVSEVMSKEKRGMGASIVSGIGIAGAVLGFLIADWFDWRIAYFVGGALGLFLLILRVSVYESEMFHKSKKSGEVVRGDFLSLFKTSAQFYKYLLTILVGVPVWFTISQLAIHAGEYAALGISAEPISSGKAVTFHYIGASVGSLLFGYLSQSLQSRKKALYIALTSLVFFMLVYFFNSGMTSGFFYALITAMGLSMGGMWAIFMVKSSEQFGTNIRATVTTTAPNFVRGMVLPISWMIGWMSGISNLWTAGLVTGLICMVLSFIGIHYSKETYGKDLDYSEGSKLL